MIRVADFPERIPLVLPTLADFECEHGRIGNCPECRASWICMCGASNGLRDNQCRNCGGHKP